MERPQRVLALLGDALSGEKIKALERAGDRIELTVRNLEAPADPVLDDTSPYLPRTLDADLILDHMKHPDLSADLAALCRKAGVPVIAPGKKLRGKGVFSPPTCCGLARDPMLGVYGQCFGAPELMVEMEDGLLSQVRVIRGAPCGATWEAVESLAGLSPEEAKTRLGLTVQQHCVADPAGWDPIHGKSPVHFAGHVHAAALERATARFRKNNG